MTLISRARKTPRGVKLRVRAEVLDRDDILAACRGTSNLLVLHTDLMGDVGVFTLKPGLDQTAYGLFSDLVEIARTILTRSALRWRLRSAPPAGETPQKAPWLHRRAPCFYRVFTVKLRSIHGRARCFHGEFAVDSRCFRGARSHAALDRQG